VKALDSLKTTHGLDPNGHHLNDPNVANAVKADEYTNLGAYLTSLLLTWRFSRIPGFQQPGGLQLITLALLSTTWQE